MFIFKIIGTAGCLAGKYKPICFFRCLGLIFYMLQQFFSCNNLSSTGFPKYCTFSKCRLIMPLHKNDSILSS